MTHLSTNRHTFRNNFGENARDQILRRKFEERKCSRVCRMNLVGTKINITVVLPPKNVRANLRTLVLAKDGLDHKR